MLDPRNTRLNRADKTLALIGGHSLIRATLISAVPKTLHMLIHLILTTTLKVPMSITSFTDVKRGFTARKRLLFQTD